MKRDLVIKNRMKELGIAEEKVIKALSLSKKDFLDRLDERVEFTISEVSKLQLILQFDDPISVFFS